jgi:hypothetical protein
VKSFGAGLLVAVLLVCVRAATTATSDMAKGEYSSINAPSVKGWIEKFFLADGTLTGWAFDAAAPESNLEVSFYVDGLMNNGGIFAGSVKANARHNGVNWTQGIKGEHGFTFRIPARWWDGREHTVSVYAKGADQVGYAIGHPRSFNLAPTSAESYTSVTDSHCLDAKSRCEYTSSNYAASMFPDALGWSDGKNYFDEWKCVSPEYFNTIERVNVMPLGTHRPQFSKDSLFVEFQDNIEIIYFTAVNADYSSVFSLKKAIYSNDQNRWKIFSVLDYPNSRGGLSSQDGRNKYFIMNDYSLPGWGPSSPIPGRSNKIPGVSDVNGGSDVPSYPLVGSGPLGITAIANTLHSSPNPSAPPEARTCLHMNPKLFDYDSEGRPHSLIVNLWQGSGRKACPLPPGAPLSELPAPGNYLYHYEGPTLGWQLDLRTGLVTDSVHNDRSNAMRQTPKLLSGSSRKFVMANWDGTVQFVDLNKPMNDNSRLVLDCRSSGVHFGEGSGKADRIFFQAVKADISAERQRYRLSRNLLPIDIYVVYKR